MRLVAGAAVAAFATRRHFRRGNTKSDGTALYLHGNKIAEWRGQPPQLWVTNAGWATPTTKERLNGLPGVRVQQKNYQWYLNGKLWHGGWVHIP